jgi:hypothetical protein
VDKSKKVEVVDDAEDLVGDPETTLEEKGRY